jgi:hypothetical protein
MEASELMPGFVLRSRPRPRGACRLYPEGMTGLSLGFQPQLSIKKWIRPEGARERDFALPNVEPNLTRTACRPFRAGSRVGFILGLKPQAQSFYPFGISPKNPRYTGAFESELVRCTERVRVAVFFRAIAKTHFRGRVREREVSDDGAR